MCSKCGFLNKCNGSCFGYQVSSNQNSVGVKFKFFLVNVLIPKKIIVPSVFSNFCVFLVDLVIFAVVF